MSGFAFSVKYLALLHMAPIALVMGWYCIRRRISVGVFSRSIAVYLGAAVLCSFIWYLRSYLYEGNPVYPFFPSIFGGTGKEYDFSKAGYGKGIVDFFLVIWRATMEPEKFGGTWAQLGILFLAFTPLLIYLRKYRDQKVKFLTFFAVIFFVEWFYLAQNLRFLFPLVPVLSMLIALSLRPFFGIFSVILLLHAGFAVYHGREGYSFLLRSQTRSEYLAGKERTYSISRWINKNVLKSAKFLIIGEIRMFYFDPEMIREHEFQKKTNYLESKEEPKEIFIRLKDADVTHLLVGYSREELITGSKHPLKRLLDDQEVVDQNLRLIHEEITLSGLKYVTYEIL